MPSEIAQKIHCIIASYLVCLVFYFDSFRPSTQNSLFHFNIVLTKISLKILLSIIYNARFTLAIIMMAKFTKSQTHSEHAIHFGNFSTGFSLMHFSCDLISFTIYSEDLQQEIHLICLLLFLQMAEKMIKFFFFLTYFF